MNPSAEQSLSLLRDSLAEAQTTVRAYDTKAQIVGVGYIFALGIVGNFESLLPELSELNLLTLSVACVAILPILLFGFVLYPSRKSAEKFAAQSEETPGHVLYVDPTKLGSVKALKEAVGRCDPIKEVSFELLTVSQLRELKRRRFLRALFSAGVVFLFIFATHFIRIQ
ncbi:MAG: hypothetical protein KAR22_13010 [Gammaproteobacteria bacterium]|nr:hypothetical protein [Gammaproteobacteria bacterium]